jgi:hypothetical protein
VVEREGGKDRRVRHAKRKRALHVWQAGRRAHEWMSSICTCYLLSVTCLCYVLCAMWYVWLLRRRSKKYAPAVSAQASSQPASQPSVCRDSLLTADGARLPG